MGVGTNMVQNKLGQLEFEKGHRIRKKMQVTQTKADRIGGV